MSTTETFTTPGAAVWVCPAGVQSVLAKCIGQGQTGTTAGATGGTGGVGGDYAEKTVAVTPGVSYDYNVPAGGATSGGAWFVTSGTVFAARSGISSPIGDVTHTGGGIGGVGAMAGAGGGGCGSAGPASNGNNGTDASGATKGNGGSAVSGGSAGGNGADLTTAAAQGGSPGGGGGGGCVSMNTAGAVGQPGQVQLVYDIGQPCRIRMGAIPRSASNFTRRKGVKGW